MVPAGRLALVALVVIFLLTVLGCHSEVRLPSGSPDKPDIVLVSVDTLRADHLHCYGNPRPTSPLMDRLAADGVRFTHARSASPWTLPSHATLLTGELPATHHVVDDELQLPASTPRLPEVLSRVGYTTGGFVSTLYVSSRFGFDQGFDHFEDFDIHSEKANLSGDVVAEDVVDHALDWFEHVAAHQPVFLFLHFYDVHYEYDPPKPYATMFDRAPNRHDRRYRNYFFFKKHPLSRAEFEHEQAQYDEAIRYVDDQLRRVKTALDAAGRLAMWVVTADHGEEFGERGSWGHAHTLYDEQLHVPLILSGPGIPKGKVIDEVVGNQDVAPTIAAWAGAVGLSADGVDLGPLVHGTPLPPRPFPAETTRFSTNRLGLYLPEPLVAALSPDGRAAGPLRLEWDLANRRAELFDPAADPTETRDLAPSRPDDVARMKAEIERLLGHPWQATQFGTVQTDGVILQNGRRRRLTVKPGDRFAVLPYDAAVYFEPAGGGAKQGPWKLAGGTRPSGALVLHDQGATGEVTIDAAMKKKLEALGYLQEEGGE